MTQVSSEQELTKNELWTLWATEAQSGDRKAYRLLLNDIVPYIKGYVSGSLANPDWVDDVVQDVLISVHKSLKSYSPDRPFKPWLSTIIQFRKTDFLRKHYKSKKTKEETFAHTEVFSTNVTNSTLSGELKDIEAAIATLPEKQQKIFHMMRIEGYSAKEVAEEMGMSVSAVKVSVHRSTNKLKGLLS